MDIVYTASDLYAPMLGVSLTSLLENNMDVEKLTIYIFEDGISSVNCAKLEATAKKYKREIKFVGKHQIEKALYSYCDKIGGIGQLNTYAFSSKDSYVTYYKLLLADFLPKSIEQALYLGSDTLVLGSLKDLFKPGGGIWSMKLFLWDMILLITGISFVLGWRERNHIIMMMFF